MPEIYPQLGNYWWKSWELSTCPGFLTIWRKSREGGGEKLQNSQNDFPQCLYLEWCFDYLQLWNSVKACFDGGWCYCEHPGLVALPAPVGLSRLSQLLSARNWARKFQNMRNCFPLRLQRGTAWIALSWKLWIKVRLRMMNFTLLLTKCWNTDLWKKKLTLFLILCIHRRDETTFKRPI